MDETRLRIMDWLPAALAIGLSTACMAWALAESASGQMPILITPQNAAFGAPQSATTLPYTPTTNELTAQLLPSVQRAYGLAQRGAMFAAQTEFIQVLRRIAQAKDAEFDTDEHSHALATGLRALDEADDFIPRGVQMEAELNVRSIASSHRTPVLVERIGEVRPQEAVALYHRYAQAALGRAAMGEQAGSMALHGMGKLFARMAERDEADQRLVRKSMTMYSAALVATPENFLAANELGVLLARNGHHAEAAAMFLRAIEVEPSSTGYHNLAVAQQKLNLLPQALANQQQADRLAAWDRATGAVSRRKGVQWVSPQDLAGAAVPTNSSAGPAGGMAGRIVPPTITAPVANPTFAPPPVAEVTEPLPQYRPRQAARPTPAKMHSSRSPW